MKGRISVGFIITIPLDVQHGDVDASVVSGEQKIHCIFAYFDPTSVQRTFLALFPRPPLVHVVVRAAAESSAFASAIVARFSPRVLRSLCAPSKGSSCWPSTFFGRRDLSPPGKFQPVEIILINN